MLYTRVYELTFKRHVMSSGMGPPQWWFFFYHEMRIFMNVYVYSDESGVFDKKHNDILFLVGLLF